MRLQGSVRMFVGALACALVAWSCGAEGPSDPEDSASSGTAEGAGDQGSQAGGDGSDDSGGQSADDAGRSGGGSNQCGAADVDTDDECELCVAVSCTDAAIACCEVPGCLDIIECAQETSCNGLDCYAPETCQDVIDAAGGPSVALQYAQPLGDCAAESCGDKCDVP